MIRLAAVQDTSQIRDLWNYCFDDTPEFVNFFFQACYQADNALVVEEEGRIQSCLQILPYRMILRDREIPISYIVGVATWPEYRGQGLIKRLLQFADKVLQDRGIYQSILLPFQYDFYRKYGWEVCYDFLTYRTLDVPSFNFFKTNTSVSRSTRGKFIRVDHEDDFDKLTKCYHQYMKPFNGYLLRGKKEWHKTIHDVMLDRGACYLYEENEKPLGYVIYTLRDRKLHISELIHLSNGAKTALLQLALSHAGQVEQVSRKAPSWDMDYLHMQDSRGKLEKETFVMGRIHSVVETLSGLPYTGDIFVVKVEDNFYENNNGTFLIGQTNGVSLVTRTDQEPDVIIDIRTLNQLLWGYLSPEIALVEERVHFINKNILNNIELLFPKKYNYMTEDF